MPTTYNNRILYSNPSAGQCNWDIDVERNNRINASLFPPILDGNGVITGGLTTPGTGLSVDITEAEVIVGDVESTVIGSNYALVGASNDPFETNFLWIDVNGTLQVTQEEPDETMVMIAIVDTDSTSVLRIIDGRKMPSKVASQGAARKNLLINGNFKVWQRGTTYNTAGGYNCADRWGMESQANTGGAISGGKVVGDYFNYLEMSFGSATSSWFMRQAIEDSRALRPATNYTLQIHSDNDTVVDMAIIITIVPNDGGTPEQEIINSGAFTVDSGITSSVFKFTTPAGYSPGTSPETTGGVYVDFVLSPSVPVPNGTYRFWNIQLEEGGTATDFEYRTMEKEILLCQRFYQVVHTGWWGTTANGAGYGGGWPYVVPMWGLPECVAVSSDASANFAAATTNDVWNIQSAGFSVQRVANIESNGRYWRTAYHFESGV